jgi:hypothetical protein
MEWLFFVRRNAAHCTQHCRGVNYHASHGDVYQAFKISLCQVNNETVLCIQPHCKMKRHRSGLPSVSPISVMSIWCGLIVTTAVSLRPEATQPDFDESACHFFLCQLTQWRPNLHQTGQRFVTQIDGLQQE